MSLENRELAESTSSQVRRSDRNKAKMEKKLSNSSPVKSLSQLYFPPIYLSTRAQYMEHLKTAHKIMEEADRVYDCKEIYSPFDEYIQKLHDIYMDLCSPPKSLRADDSAEASDMLIRIRSRASELVRRKSEVLELKKMLDQSQLPSPDAAQDVAMSSESSSSAKSESANSEAIDLPNVETRGLSITSARSLNLPISNLQTALTSSEARKSVKKSELYKGSSGILQYRTPSRRRSTSRFHTEPRARFSSFKWIRISYPLMPSTNQKYSTA